MTVPWSSFYNYIYQYVPNCPSIVIDEHLPEAAAEFCRRSGIWRFDIETDYTANTMRDYEIDVPTGAVLENIIALYVEGARITPVTDRHFDVSPLTESGQPTYFSLYQDTSIRFYPTPDARYSFSGVATLKPKLTATGVEDFIYETHGRAIACGAIARIAEIPAKDWTNQDVANQHRMMFYKAADVARMRDPRQARFQINYSGSKFA